jgi:predicted TIM-barrel fold metal-dependent hydrolase
MVIDAYSHGYYGKYLDQLIEAGGNWAKQNLDRVMAFAQKKPYIIDIFLRMKLLDKYGIDQQLVTTTHRLDCNLLPSDSADQLVLAKAINDHMARLTEDSKGRLLAGGSVPLSNFEQSGRQEMERAIKNLGLKAICISSNFNGKPPDLPEFEPFWAQAAEMNVPVYIHPHDPVGRIDRSYEGEYDLTHNFGWPYETTLALARLVFSGITERYPTLKVVAHHLGGGMIPFFMGRINETYNPADQQKKIGRVLTKPLFEYFSRFYYDTAVGGSAPAIRCAYEVFGADQLIFATDAPHGPGLGENRMEEYPQVIRSLGFSEAENKKIFAENARRVLNLE